MKSEFLLKRFVENYYEIHGDFSGIDISFVSTDLRYWAKQNSMTILEYCYTLLGYPAGITMHELDVYGKLQIHGIKWLQENNLSENWMEDIGYLPKFIYRLDSRVNPKIVLAEKMLFEYLKNTEELLTTVDDVTMTVKDFVMYLKNNKKSISKKEVLSQLESNHIMVRFIENIDSNWKVINKTFIYNNLTQKQIEQVKLEVVSDLLYGDGLKAGALGDLIALPFLAINDHNTYLAVLDMCRGLGITYAKYMEAFDYIVPDQTLALKELDMIVQKVGSYVYYTTNECTDKEPLLKIPAENFAAAIAV